MCYGIAIIISIITWIYIFIASFKDGCLWPVLILLFGPIAILVYVILAYKGDKVIVLAGFYAPLLVSLIAKFVVGF